jgi:small redox-active disulfide protein 2
MYVHNTKLNILIIRKGNYMIVKVLGTGCSKCKLLEQRLIDLKAAHQLEFEVEKVTQLNDIINYGAMMTPGLVINEKLKAVGKIPNDQDILKWIKEDYND